jgi:cysteinyl-tRNA synthetase
VTGVQTCALPISSGKKVDEAENRLTLETLTGMGFSGREIRFWMLATHYRKALHFSDERLMESRRALQRLDGCIQDLLNVKEGKAYPELGQIVYDIKHGFIHAMNEDLNMSEALAAMFAAVKKLNALIQEKNIDEDGAHEVLKVFRDLDAVLNIFDFSNLYLNDLVKALIEKREKARAEKDWDRADRLRARLEELGIRVRDPKI